MNKRRRPSRPTSPSRQASQTRQTAQSRATKRRRTITIGVLGAVVIGLSASLSAALLTGGDSATSTTAPRAAATSTGARQSTTTTERPVERFELIAVEELPPEARVTLVLIEGGGPFPYEEDGRVFENREGILPDQPDGYYSEYTVETPGSEDRGARRIVAGDGGERYYTEDHYDSFDVIDTESGA